KVGYNGLAIQNRTVSVKLLNAADADKVRQSLRDVDRDMTTDIDSAGNASLTLPDSAVQQRQSRAVDQSIEVVRRRVDATGVKEPTIQRQGEDRILVQVPGVTDPEELEGLLTKTAKMTFQFVDQNVTQDQIDKSQVPDDDIVYAMAANARAGMPPKLAVK